MSTALLDEVRSTTEEVEEQGLVLDATTRQRMEVARCAADTMEELADTGAWDRLDPAIAAHLAGHARRLCGFLERVRGLGAVRDAERELLAVRRVERRLEVCLDLLVEDDEEASTDRPVARKKKRGAAKGDEELFLGDFTNKQLSEEQRQQVAERRKKKKEARRLLSPRAKRMVLYVAACLAMTVGSLMLVAMSELGSSGPSGPTEPPVKEPMQLNEYLEDVQVFLPAKLVVQQQDTAVVMVRREWLLESQEQRQVDADGAHVFLSNRAIPRLELFWEDGGLIGRAERDGHFVFRDGNAGISSRPKGESAAEPAADAGSDLPPGLTPPPGVGP